MALSQQILIRGEIEGIRRQDASSFYLLVLPCRSQPRVLKTLFGLPETVNADESDDGPVHLSFLIAIGHHLCRIPDVFPRAHIHFDHYLIRNGLPYVIEERWIFEMSGKMRKRAPDIGVDEVYEPRGRLSESKHMEVPVDEEVWPRRWSSGHG